MLSAPGQAVTRTALWPVAVWTGEQEREPGHKLQHWEERRAREEQPPVIMPNLQRQSKESIKSVGETV